MAKEIKGLERIKLEFKNLARYNELMRYSFSRKGVLYPDEQSELEDLKEIFNYKHTAQVSIEFADRLVLEYEILHEQYQALTKHIDSLEEKLSRPKGLLGIFSAR